MYCVEIIQKEVKTKCNILIRLACARDMLKRA